VVNAYQKCNGDVCERRNWPYASLSHELAPMRGRHAGPASSRKEVILAIELGVDQALDDGENERGREAEH
jgi:hypothetical protein